MGFSGDGFGVTGLLDPRVSRRIGCRLLVDESRRRQLRFVQVRPADFPFRRAEHPMSLWCEVCDVLRSVVA